MNENEFTHDGVTYEAKPSLRGMSCDGCDFRLAPGDCKLHNDDVPPNCGPVPNRPYYIIWVKKAQQ